MPKSRGFQDLVRAYDKKYWVHKPGAESLRHTCLHLMSALGRTVASCNSTRNFNDLLIKQLPGRLLEHAARIANNTRTKITVSAGSLDAHAPVMANITTPGVSTADMPLNYKPTHDATVFLNLMTQVGTLATVCERLDHRFKLQRADKQKLHDVICELLNTACETGPLSREELKPEMDFVYLFLVPLNDRLRELEYRHESGQFTRVCHTP